MLDDFRELPGMSSSAMNTILPPKDLSLIHLPDGRPLRRAKKSWMWLHNAMTANITAPIIGTQVGVALVDCCCCGAATLGFIPGNVTWPDLLFPEVRSVNCTVHRHFRHC